MPYIFRDPITGQQLSDLNLIKPVYNAGLIQSVNDTPIDPHHDDTSNHASSIMGCNRKIWYKRRGMLPKGIPVEPNNEWDRQLGSLIHDQEQKRLIKFGMPIMIQDWAEKKGKLLHPGKLRAAIEVPLNKWTCGPMEAERARLDVRGKMDGVLSFELDGEDYLFILEIKTISSRALTESWRYTYTDDKVAHDWYPQVQTYMHFLRLQELGYGQIEKTVIWVINRGDRDIRPELAITYNPDYVKNTLLPKLEEAAYYEKNKETPPRLKPTKHNLERICRWCPAKEICKPELEMLK